ncbi:alanine--glyoxylate aminotransferase 2 [Tyrophagus putrescentiae]|nr:alanine--glyoxylate aminotransferase 2 [Tyrophagus putrescentiae]
MHHPLRRTTVSRLPAVILQRTLATSSSSSKQPPELPPCDFVPDLAESKLGKFEIERIHKLNLNPSLKPYYSEPLLITQGHRQYVWDNKKRRYLDMFGGIVTTSVGHSHPTLLETISRQSRKLWHVSSVYLNEEVHEYAAKLANHFPEPLNNVIFCNSGSEANDIALLMARSFTGAFDVVALRNAYHGCSTSTMPLCGDGSVGGFCRDSPVQTNRSCDCKEGGGCAAAEYYAEELEEVLSSTLPKRIAGFFAESIQGVGGTVQYPTGFLQRAYELVKARGGLFISDEVQTGFGRTGEHFWGFQGHGIVPDIVTMAKGIGNGFPLAAVITTQSVASSLTRAMHFNTFGGNPLSSAVGSAVLDIIEAEKLQENSLRVGTLLLRKLAELRDGRFSDIVGDVRGKGLMIGLELMVSKERNHRTAVPMPVEQVNGIFEDCRSMGLIIGKGGPSGNVFRIKPPMCITEADVTFTVDVLKVAFERHYERLARSSQK